MTRTIPARADSMINNMREDAAMEEIVPESNEKNRENEKSEKRIL